jgi:hypothetical protein
MIEPTSLRLGNLVMYDNRIFEIDCISKALPTLNTYEFGIGVVEWKDLQLIPLTEELLLQFGGIKNDRASYPSYNLNGLLIDFIKGKWIEYVSQIEIKGVHHLQNVIYFRTNQELTKIDKK